MIIAVAFTVSIIYPTMSIILSGQQSSYKHIQIWTNLSSARPLPAVRWPCLPSTFIFSLILKASLSLPPSQPVPLINSTHSISFPSFHSSPASHAFPIARASRQCHSPWCQCSCLPHLLALLSHSVSFWPGVYRICPVQRWWQKEWKK